MQVKRERDELRIEKEEEATALTSRLHAMERSYETILQVYIYTYMYMYIYMVHGTCNIQQPLQATYCIHDCVYKLHV